ncbi:MAG: peptide-N-glycosidase F-related protein [Bacteroidota bacterium]
MNNIFRSLLLISILCTSPIFTKAGPGDTTHVQTFTFGSPQNAKFQFPPNTLQTRKILMYYTLKCNPAQSPACGEWDYLTYTYLYEHTGKLDSTMLSAHSYVVDGASPDSLHFMKQPSYKYFPHFSINPVYTDTLSLNTASIGNGVLQSTFPFHSSDAESRTQYLWKASELITSGMTTGNITGIRFNIQSAGSMLKNLIIRIKHCSLDSITAENVELTGFTTVYQNNTLLVSGWNSLQFINPFNWDGTSNLLVDISFDNAVNGASTAVLADNPGWKSGLATSDNDQSLFFEGADYVSVPASALAPLDSFITVSFWQYGDPAHQPQDQSTFEATDSQGRRVLNAHIPWSNGNVYWDAGNSHSGNYDRINKAAQTQDYEGTWNYWTFTKNIADSSMKIYLNGHLWHSGVNMKRTMDGIATFKIGSFANGSGNYDGYMDEFALWNAALDSNTIKTWMFKDLDNTHPYNNNLLFYYKFNENNMLLAADSSTGGNNAALTGLPVHTLIPGSELFRNYKELNTRPNVIFEQGVFVSHADTVVTVDSVQMPPMEVIFYSDSLNPISATDTMIVWPEYFNHYVFNGQGIATDSSLVAFDSVIYLHHWSYYSVPFEVINRIELGRYITPYGNGLSLGNGFTWVFDVSDYRSLLVDSVHLSAGNWQELLDLRFDFIEGTPAREPFKVQNLWCGGFSYGSNTETLLSAKTISIDSAAVNTRFKMRPTGHGFGGNENCSEFCAKNHKIKVGGIQRFSKLVWKNDCGVNPVYPQGGTWVYSRANWCPGDDVPTFDFELTPYVTPGQPASLDYDIDAYTWNGQGSAPYYQIETQVISYHSPNFTLDGEIYDIKTPGSAHAYKRLNPICNNPLITIRNGGTDTLRSLVITYGLEGGTPTVFNWSGHLAFTEMTDVQLGAFAWDGAPGRFYATVSAPNGGTDQNTENNTMKTQFIATPVYPPGLIFEFKTNTWPQENAYTLVDDAGNIILQKSALLANKTYKDTVNLPDGCYIFKLTDSGDDGLTWWANPDQGSGSMRIKRASNGAVIKSFNSDFGSEIYQQFTVGFNLLVDEIPENKGTIDIYPNPSSGKFTAKISLSSPQNIEIRIMDILGNSVLTEKVFVDNEMELPVDIGESAPGLYIVSVKTASGNLMYSKINVMR